MNIQKDSMFRMEGLAGTGGYACGQAVVYAGTSCHAERRTVQDTQAEHLRFSAGRDAYHHELESCLSDAGDRLDASMSGIFRAYLDILEDDSFFDEALAHMEEASINVEAAILEKMEEVCAIFSDMDDELLRGRAADIENVCQRLCAYISGTASSFSLEGHSGQPVILFADDLTPADTLKLDKSILAGFVTQKGSLSSHTAILAKALSIPAIVGVSDILREVADGDPVLLAGQEGLLILRPSPEAEKQFLADASAYQAMRAVYETYATRPAVTVDGYAVQICQNAGDADSAAAFRGDLCDGIGLLRTEFLYMSCDHWPNEEEQYAFYRDVTQALQGKELIIRTLDIGGDKQIPYMDQPQEDNPFLGVRAIRTCLRHPQQFKVQLRAILRAAALGPVKIMFPMVSILEDLLEARALADEARKELEAEGIPCGTNVPIGIMVETPAAVFTSSQLAQHCDFFSIGANDLTQYLMAADRGNANLLRYQDFCAPALISAIAQTVRSAHAAGIPAGICGEAAGIPLLAPIWAGLEIDELSMSVSQVPEVKYNICRMYQAQAADLAARAQQCQTAQQVRALLTDFLQQLK